MNTIRIYETDSHARRLQARVLSCEESENGWLVELDRTIFYPTGGGQPCDTGALGTALVTHVPEHSGAIAHTAAPAATAPPSSALLTNDLDMGFPPLRGRSRILSRWFSPFAAIESVSSEISP